MRSSTASKARKFAPTKDRFIYEFAACRIRLVKTSALHGCAPECIMKLSAVTTMLGFTTGRGRADDAFGYHELLALVVLVLLEGLRVNVSRRVQVIAAHSPRQVSLTKVELICCLDIMANRKDHLYVRLVCSLASWQAIVGMSSALSEGPGGLNHRNAANCTVQCTP
ncbi:hypothetical protein GN244_ATG06498 [Phytophthora infestans]|uniref:Uncharacterized protein n=1 Tax=Phytophthora infestans TaxID=4787 RepID=A0A833TCZ5_PHYIN|nr:hypothetical protein GN244_ATG06498 [Phytophthora infestans]KAF4149730.1 hypothetical protein GN958_ATG01126 [Phytophthora infestans]